MYKEDVCNFICDFHKLHWINEVFYIIGVYSGSALKEKTVSGKRAKVKNTVLTASYWNTARVVNEYPRLEMSLDRFTPTSISYSDIYLISGTNSFE